VEVSVNLRLKIHRSFRYYGIKKTKPPGLDKN